LTWTSSEAFVEGVENQLKRCFGFLVRLFCCYSRFHYLAHWIGHNPFASGRLAQWQWQLTGWTRPLRPDCLSLHCLYSALMPAVSLLSQEIPLVIAWSLDSLGQVRTSLDQWLFRRNQMTSLNRLQ